MSHLPLSVSPYRSRKHEQTGFSLLEILIAVLVFSIGVLGLAALQLKSKQASYEAVQRTLASSLAYEILERMRMNSVGASSPLIDYVTATGTRTLDASTTISAMDCSASTCTSAQIADYDLQTFLTALRGASELRAGGSVGGLVNPTACLSGPADGSSGAYSVTIVWRGQAELTNANPTTCGQGNYGTNDRYRRILVITTYITHE